MSIVSRVAASMNCIGRGVGVGAGTGAGDPNRVVLVGFAPLCDGVCLGWVPGG